MKKKKTLAQKIAEKEEAAEAARLEKLKQEEEAKQADTPEARLAEKLRLQKLAEENDLKLAQEPHTNINERLGLRQWSYSVLLRATRSDLTDTSFNQLSLVMLVTVSSGNVRRVVWRRRRRDRQHEPADQGGV